MAYKQHRRIRISLLRLYDEIVRPPGYIHHGFSTWVSIGKHPLIIEEILIISRNPLIHTVILLYEPVVRNDLQMFSLSNRLGRLLRSRKRRCYYHINRAVIQLVCKELCLSESCICKRGVRPATDLVQSIPFCLSMSRNI